jgi:hypothetical protein
VSQIILPFTINDGDPVSAGPVMANYQAITSVVNGALELGTNVLAGPPQTQTGATTTEGSSPNGARADHQHAIRGFEQLTTDPTSNNFVGRVYTNTGTGKIRVCINATGSGTWATMGNLAASDLVAHQANHVAGGNDLLSPPRVQLTRSGAGGIPDATITAVAFGTGSGTEVYDTDTMHDMTTNPNRITFTHGGTYQLSANCAWAANGTGSRWMMIELNGTGKVIAGNSCSGFSSGDNPQLSCSCDFVASAADYVELYVMQNSGGTLNLLGTSSGMAAGGAGHTPAMSFSARWVSA